MADPNKDELAMIRATQDLLLKVVTNVNELGLRGYTVRFGINVGASGKQELIQFDVLAPINLAKLAQG